MPILRTNCTGSRRFVSRRNFLQTMGGGLGSIALADLLHAEAEKSHRPAPHHKPTAKRVLMLFMSAGVSHVDTFDYKPELTKYSGQPITGKGNVQDVFFRKPGKLMPSPFAFKQYGESGRWCSELFPHVGRKADDLTFIHSMVAKANSHGPAMLDFMTGEPRNGFPSLGAWSVYGLGSETQDLPAFVVMMDRGMPPSSTANWGNGFLPARFQGTTFRSSGDPILDLKPPSGYADKSQRDSFDFLAKLNEEHLRTHPHENELSARIASYELAARMQASAPEVADIARESQATHKLYGTDRTDVQQANFSRICLRARRLLERGVRFVTVFSGGSNNKQPSNWDAHSNIENQSPPQRDDGRPTHRGVTHRLEISRPARGHTCDLDRRIRPHADSRRFKGTRPQHQRLYPLDGGRRNETGIGLRSDRRKSAFRLSRTPSPSPTCTPPSCTPWD